MDQRIAELFRHIASRYGEELAADVLEFETRYLAHATVLEE